VAFPAALAVPESGPVSHPMKHRARFSLASANRQIRRVSSLGLVRAVSCEFLPAAGIDSERLPRQQLSGGPTAPAIVCSGFRVAPVGCGVGPRSLSFAPPIAQADSWLAASPCSVHHQTRGSFWLAASPCSVHHQTRGSFWLAASPCPAPETG